MYTNTNIPYVECLNIFFNFKLFLKTAKCLFYWIETFLLVYDMLYGIKTEKKRLWQMQHDFFQIERYWQRRAGTLHGRFSPSPN